MQSPFQLAVENPAIEQETRAAEELDLPWQVVVHNDPVNLMSYVTMVFQRVFGLPREQAEKHMLEVHQQGRSILWSGMRERGGTLRPATPRLPAPRYAGANRLIWKSVAREIASRFPSSIHFWQSFCAKSRRARTPMGRKRRSNACSVRPRRPLSAKCARNGKLYVEPELRRLFQTATETVGVDLQQLNGCTKPFANCTLRIPTKNADAWLNALNQARLVIAAQIQFQRGRAVRSLSFADRITARPGLVPGQFLRVSPGIYFARAENVWSAAEHSRLQPVCRLRTIVISRSFRASEDLAGRKLRANASCML